MMLFSAGCADGGNVSNKESALSIRLLREGIQSGFNRPDSQAIWIENSDQFEKMVARLFRFRFSPPRDLSDRVNFSRESVLIVAMGLKPTGGFRLELSEKFAAISGDAAVLTVNWIEPPKDAILPQIITSPFLMVIISKGRYARIRVIDQDAHLRLEFRIP